MSVSNVYITSENLIKDLSFKQKLGMKADLIDEVLLVVDHAAEKYNGADSDSKGVQIDGHQVCILSFFLTIE